MRRFLIAFNWWHPSGVTGFGNATSEGEGLPTMEDLADLARAATPLGPRADAEVVILAVSEVSPHGPVVF